MEKYEFIKILNLLNRKRGFDFSGYRKSMLERRIQKRIYSTGTTSLDDYFEYLKNYPLELDNLIDVFTINVSRFFRNSISFEFITKFIIPDLIASKVKEKDFNIRIWSAGCATGEEPYSVAIILNEILKKNKIPNHVNIFGTDIDKKALKAAKLGRYHFSSVEEVKLGIFKDYFTEDKGQYKIDSTIKKMVNFSLFDMLDKKYLVPPDSIFGGFDVVLCRNLLIYFEPEYQKTIFKKIHSSLNKNGYLILGEAEVPIEGFKHRFKRENNCCKIYRKIE